MYVGLFFLKICLLIQYIHLTVNKKPTRWPHRPDSFILATSSLYLPKEESVASLVLSGELFCLLHYLNLFSSYLFYVSFEEHCLFYDYTVLSISLLFDDDK